MSSYPCTNLITTKKELIAIYGPYIHVLDLKSGKLLQSNSPSEDLSRPTIPSSSSIRTASVSLAEQRLVTVDDKKQLKVWDLSNLTLLSSRELPKKASQVLLTKDGQTILVADKFGDVFSYPLVAPDIPRAAPKQNMHNQDGRKSLASHENPSLGSLILGHTSSLISMLLSPDEKFVLTSDRDEHIRISHYPRGYNIEQYCLGHTKYVSALHIPKHEPTTLISAGGDRSIYFWNYLSGTLEHKLEIWDLVYANTKVASQRRKFKRLESKAGTGWRARRRRERELKEEQERRQRELQSQASAATDADGSKQPDEDEEMKGDNDAVNGMSHIFQDSPLRVDVPVKGDSDGTGTLEDSGRSNMQGGILIGPARAKLPSLDDVIVVSKIDTLRHESQYALVFIAVGANAVFFVPYDFSTSRPSHDQTHQYTLPSPVLDFTVASREDGGVNNRLWVSIDHEFQNEEEVHGTASDGQDSLSSSVVHAGLKAEMTDSKPSTNGIYLLEWTGNDTMIELTAELEPVLCTLRSLSAIPGEPALSLSHESRSLIEVHLLPRFIRARHFKTLRSTANKSDLQTLDLYSLLTTLPKTEELEEPEMPVQPRGLDVSMENSVVASLDEKADMNDDEQTASGQATSTAQRGDAGVQSDNTTSQKRAVKKDGRKKWQAKMEMRQQETKVKVFGSDNDSVVKTNAELDLTLLSPVTKEGIPMDIEGNVHDGIRTDGGKRKAIEKEDAEYSEGHISKRLKMGDPQ